MNMQAVQAGWVGKTFALPRCSDSRGKKPRSRRTKEERRTMVDSFIKKYRNLNNGKFPSLNLTHKEVGGSFYIVREIVREIIQENRVLGPGNSTSKALNLEHCFEEHSGESSTMDISGHLSLSTISHAIDQRQENYSLSKEHRRISEEIIEIDESITQETSASHPDDISVSQVMHGEPCHENFSNGTYLRGNLVSLGYKEANLGKLSGQTDGNSGVYDEIDAEVQVSSSEDPGIRKVEQPIPLCQTVSITSPLGEFVVDSDDTGNKSNAVARQTYSSAASNSAPEIAGADSLPETNISLNSITSNVSEQVQPYSCDREDSPFASAAAKTGNPDRSRETEGLTISLEVSKTLNAEVGVGFVPFEKDSVIKRTEPTEIHSSSAVDEVSPESLSKPVSQSSDSPATVATRSALQPLLQPNDSENVITNIESASGESLQPSAKGATYLEVKAEHEHMVCNTASASNSSSISSDEANKASETSEINPFWAAIKSLFTAVVKFWTE